MRNISAIFAPGVLLYYAVLVRGMVFFGSCELQDLLEFCRNKNYVVLRTVLVNYSNYMNPVVGKV